jgi:hypothetical protein
LRLNHVELIDEDAEWLAATERLSIWNVKVPLGLLACLEKLWWLDIRGGSALSLCALKGVENLQYLAINQVRGARDLSALADMSTLRYLDLYGLPKVTALPSFSSLLKLEHVSIGQLKGLHSLREILEAPNLRELQFIKRIDVGDDDVEAINTHPSLEQFGWFAEDVPVKVWRPVLERIRLPRLFPRPPEH